MIDLQKPPTRFGFARLVLVLLTLSLALSLGVAVLSLPLTSVGLADRVQANVPLSGVTNPVTAVLLNFRAYDTLLEVGVLLLAVFGLRSFGRPHDGQRLSMAAPEPILLALIRLLVPVMVLVAGYLLWVGAHAPGGAFQGGAVLGAAAVLLLLSGLPFAIWVHGWPFRAGLMIGFALFLAVGVGAMFAGGRFLEYPREWASNLILLVEAALTLSIGCILAALFVGILVVPSGANRTRGNP